jgi:hypothetical protein
VSREEPHRPVQPLTADVYAHLPVFDDFARLTDPALYTPLPNGWVLGSSDIVQSTAAIAARRYKVVNTAAAAVIAAVANALGEHDLPFVFGGDGASWNASSTLRLIRRRYRSAEPKRWRERAFRNCSLLAKSPNSIGQR